MAGPFTGADFEKLVPADKKLSAAWVRSLFERGEPEWFAGTDLNHIGMQVGGICCGQVYLSGDGRLWHWDIFNQNVATDTGGSHYNSHNTRQGEDVAAGDAHTGSMTSKPFTIERRFIRALIGGGADANQVALQLLIDDQVVAALAGGNNNAMTPKAFDVGKYAGKTARLRIIDKGTGSWHNIGVDQIVFTDHRVPSAAPIDDR